ncbi:hypothetical protein L9F63_004973, partial [Diploptera punctata]
CYKIKPSAINMRNLLRKINQERPCGLYGKPSEDGLDLSTDVLVFLGPYVQLGYNGMPILEVYFLPFSSDDFSILCSFEWKMSDGQSNYMNGIRTERRKEGDQGFGGLAREDGSSFSMSSFSSSSVSSKFISNRSLISSIKP